MESHSKPSRRAALLAALICAPGLIACGEDESTAPAAAHTFASGITDDFGHPVGEDTLGSAWTVLSPDQRLATAKDFINEHPAECAGVAAEDLEDQTFHAYYFEFTYIVRVGEAMLKTCRRLRN